MKEETVKVFNPRWVKVAIILGIVFFGAGSLGSAYIAIMDNSAVAEGRMVMAGVSALFGWLCLIGYTLVPFLNQTLILDEEGFTSEIGGKVTRHFWTSVRFRVRDRVQVVEIRDRSRRKIAAFDFYATNAYHLLSHAENK